MQTFVFAKDTILRFSSVLTKRFEETRLVLSIEVVKELMTRNPDQRHIWLDWDRKIHANPTVSLDEQLAADLDNDKELEVLRSLEQKGDGPLFLVTDDVKLQERCMARGLKTMSSTELESLLKTLKRSRTPVDDLSFNVFISLGLLSVIGCFYSVISLQPKMSTLDIVLVTAALIIFGFFLYSIRQRFKLAYAIVEIVVGISTVCNSELQYLKIIGGLYIIVRGLDNTGVALKKMGRYQLYAQFSRLLFLKDEEDIKEKKL